MPLYIPSSYPIFWLSVPFFNILSAYWSFLQNSATNTPEPMQFWADLFVGLIGIYIWAGS